MFANGTFQDAAFKNSAQVDDQAGNCKVVFKIWLDKQDGSADQPLELDESTSSNPSQTQFLFHAPRFQIKKYEHVAGGDYGEEDYHHFELQHITGSGQTKPSNQIPELENYFFKFLSLKDSNSFHVMQQDTQQNFILSKCNQNESSNQVKHQFIQSQISTSNDDFGKYQLEAMLPNMELILKDAKKINEEMVVFYAA